MSLPASPFRVALVGAGKVGTAVASLLQAAGHHIVSVSSRSSAGAELTARRFSTTAVPLASIPDVDVVLLGVPGSALEDVAAALPRVGAVLVHFAGAVGIAPLEAAAGARAVCALHPVQSCPEVDIAIRRLPGSAWGVTCSRGAEGWARGVVEEDLKGLAFEVLENDRLLWHAAAVTTSNGLSALFALGESLLWSIGVTSPERVLGPITMGTLSNALEGGGGGPTLTGPVVRKEVDLIVRQVSEVGRRAPDLLPGYLHSVHMIVSAAAAAGRIDRDDEALFHGALDA